MVLLNNQICLIQPSAPVLHHSHTVAAAAEVGCHRMTRPRHIAAAARSSRVLCSAQYQSGGGYDISASRVYRASLSHWVAPVQQLTCCAGGCWKEDSA